MRIISFSADGLQQAADRGLYEWLAEQDADFICIQDLRCSEHDLQDARYFPGDYNAYFFDDVDGKANGVAIYCRKLPKAIMTGLGFADFDMEGRYIQADYRDVSVGCLLAPAAAPDDDDALARKTRFLDLYGAHLQKVRNKRRHYIICGNWQIAPGPADVAATAAAGGKPGTLPQEREWLAEVLAAGYVDAFRQVNSDRDEFTAWPDAEHGDGALRTDLQLVSEALRSKVEHGAIYTRRAFSSHAPVIIDYDLEV